MLRPLLEKATRSLTFRRYLPHLVGGGPIYVSGSAGLKYLFKSMDAIDPVLCGLAQEFVKEGDVVWDVGANIGLFSFSAAHIAGSAGGVYAFEADTWLVQLLRKSAAIQATGSAAVSIVPTAIAECCDLRTFNIAVRSRASNALSGYGQSQTGGVAEHQTVVSLSLDWLSERLPLPKVIKIDVEGAELEVLRGGRNLFAKHAPILLCEVCSESSAAVSKLLAELGYRIYDGDLRATERHELPLAPWNTIAVRA